MKAYLSEPIAASAYNRLKADFEIVSDFSSPEEIDAIIVRNLPITKEIIESCTNLKVISDHGVGMDNIDVKAAEERGIPVLNTPGANSRAVAELAVAMLLALNRKLKPNSSGLLEGRFTSFGQKEMVSNEAFDKKLGLVGSGMIASQMAAIMRNAFHNEIFCYNPHETAEELKEKGFIKVETLKELFAEMDFVSLHLPLTEESRNMIGREVFSCANPDLILINTSRGGIINEDDLYEALVNGRIRAAGLDVFATEPPAPDHPLLSLDNFIGTYHVGGSTEEALERVGNFTIDNVYKGLEIFKENQKKRLNK